MANPRKPTILKAISGTIQRCREPSTPPVELELVAACPDAPNWLPNAHAVKEWHRLVVILTNARLLTLGGLSALAVLCALHGKLVQLWAAGDSPNASMLAAYRNLINDFGLTPVAQGRVTATSARHTSNPFTTNGKRDTPYRP